MPIAENPLLRSGIAMSGANVRQSGANDDGILTALEVAQLDLQGTELVVLSACDTGMGEVHNGEGVYGLRRALVIAGAQTQVTSLWKVSDEATRILMLNYYERLLKGEGRSAALRNAQLAMLASSDFSDPYYWASFISIGNRTPLRSVH
jgi:CHAT domain-containing protein